MAISYFHLHLVSDATGETLIAVSRAVAAQFDGVYLIEHLYPLVRSQAQLDKAIAEIEAKPGLVLFTLVDLPLCREARDRLSEYQRPQPLRAAADPQPFPILSWRRCQSAPPGAQHMLNADYFKRIDALNYTMMHDDGQMQEQLRSCRCSLDRREPHLEDADEHLSRQPRYQDGEYSARAECRAAQIRLHAFNTLWSSA